MAISNIRVTAVTHESGGAGSDSVDINLSTLSLVAGDLIIISANANSAADSPSTPSGYTQFTGSGSGSGRGALYWKAAAGGETSVTVTFAGTAAGKACYAIAVAGANTSSPEDASAAVSNNSSAANMTYPNYTLVDSGAAVFYVGFKSNLEWTSIAAIPSFTEIVDESSVAIGGSANHSVCAGYQNPGASVSTGTMTVTGDGSSTNYCVIFGIKAAASGNAARSRFQSMLRNA